MQTPIEYCNPKNLGLRQIPYINVRFNFAPPGQVAGTHRGKKFTAFRKLKEHIIFTTRILTVLDTHELWQIKLGIQAGEVPLFWEELVTAIWKFKKSEIPTEGLLVSGFDGGRHKTSIQELVLGDGGQLDIFEYSSGAKFYDKFDE